MTKWSSIPAGTLDHTSGLMWDAFGDDASKVANALTRDKALAERIADFVRRDQKFPANFELARKIMGRNFFGPKEGRDFFGIRYDAEESAFFRNVPFSVDRLEACRDTHVLVAVLPISILEMCDVPACKGLIKLGDWYGKCDFSQTKSQAHWHLVRKASFPGSEYRIWDAQTALFADDEEVPDARVQIYTVLGYFLLNKERLFEQGMVRTSNMVSDKYVTVGNFDSRGLELSISWGGDRQQYVGIASAVGSMPVKADD